MRFLIILSLLFPYFISGNGCQVDGGFINSTGNLTLLKNANIVLESENIEVKFDKDFAIVQVDYRFINNGPDTSIDYGFPITFPAYLLDKDTYDERMFKEGQHITYNIADMNSGILKYKTVIPQTITSKIEPEEIKEVTKWFISKLSFKSNENKHVRVKYKLKCSFEDWVTTKRFFTMYSDRCFKYLMKPSGNWGTGVIKDCSIKLDIRSILKTKGKITSIKPSGYSIDEGIIQWNHKNFDLTKAENLEFVFQNNFVLKSKEITGSRIKQNLLHKVKTSSTLKTSGINKYDYSWKCLFDRKLNTAWVEGKKGPGHNEWIEVTFKKNVYVGAIGIINGYTKKEKLYKANNRIKKLKIQMWAIDSFNKIESERYNYILDLPEKQFNELNMKLSTPFIQWIAEHGDSGFLTTKVRLTIIDTYKGSKYNDTCISELYFLGGEVKPLEDF